jgi:hypothetical protein
VTAVLPARGRAAAPERRPSTRPGRHLSPVDRPRSRRSPAIPALVGVGMVIAALLALAVMHGLLIGGQVRLDGMRREVASETESIRRLELRVAELESPDRVLDVARDRLGMVQPSEVGYLLPVGVPGAPVEPVRVAAAEATAPEVEAEATDATTSAEQAEVDRAIEDVTETGEGTDEVAGAASATEQPSEGGRDE